MQLVGYLTKIFIKIEKSFSFETEIKWANAIFFISYHTVAVYWCWHFAFPVKWQTVLFAVMMHAACRLGVTCGAHRYWTHRSYEATVPLQLLLLIMFSCGNQTSILEWVRNHRLHHKFGSTSADPHNAKRGLFYSHIGWLMMEKHPEAMRKGKIIDMSDVDRDLLLKWHENYISWINSVCCFILPTAAGVWLWGERWQTAAAWQCCIRYAVSFYSELALNSFAHAQGYGPYKPMAPTESWFASMATLGEGWNYHHHAFSFDYKAAQYCGVFDLSTRFIRMCRNVGWAYDLKEAVPESVRGSKTWKMVVHGR